MLIKVNIINRLRAIWPKGYQHGSPRKSHQNGDYLYSCCIFLDLSKAFDSVQHDILFCKLEKLYGFRGNALELLNSYLIKRVQEIKIGNGKPKQLKIDCGIPQGSSRSSTLHAICE